MPCRHGLTTVTCAVTVWSRMIGSDGSRGPARSTPLGSSRPTISWASRAASMQRGQVDAGVDAHVVQHVHDLLGGHVAGRAGRVRAAAEPADARVELGDAELQRGQDVGQRGAPGVVEVQQHRHVGLARRTGVEQVARPGAGSPCRSCRRTRSGRRRRRPPGRRWTATRSGSTSPSNGQPKLVATITSTLAPAVVHHRDQLGDVVQRLVGGAVDVAPVVRVATPRPPPRSRGSRRRAPAGRPGCSAPAPSSARRRPWSRAAHTSSASAICGIAFGCTKQTASIRRTPVRGQRVEQPHLGLGRDRLLVLQPVARPDLADRDARRPTLIHARSTCRQRRHRIRRRRSPVS